MMPPEIISTTPFPAAPAVRERPILFSAPMVRALLAGTKTQTRRVVKITHRTPGLAACLEPSVGAPRPRVAAELCPYGQPDDRLWVREAHAPRADCLISWQRSMAEACNRMQPTDLCYRADEKATDWVEKWRPSIHMPRWASRILLEVTEVRVERLQDISEADARAEGVRHGYGEPLDPASTISDRRRYELLWDQINGAGAWAANPWVWAVSFHRVPPTGGISETPPGGSTA